MRFPRGRGHSAQRAAGADARLAVSAQMAEVARLQRDLHRARARYEAALAEIEGRAAGLSGGAVSNGHRLQDAGAAGGRAAGETQPAAVLTWDHEGAEAVSIGTASFEELRGLGLSVTQATRILDHRARGAVQSVDDLDSVPGIPRAKLERLKEDLRD